MTSYLEAVGPHAAGQPLLDVRNLSVDFRSGKTWTRVVDDVSFSVRPGEIVGVVGESGSGKTVTALALMGLLAPNSRVPTGQVLLEGRDILKLGPDELSDLRGDSIAMIFQEPMRSLNPGFTVGDQIAEAVRRHRPEMSRADAWARAVEMLELVEIPNAAKRAGNYPHQMSGGMCQRVMIAMALACDPKLLIADEPTTALDVTVQAQILRLMLELRDRIGVGIILITHDLGVVAETCDRTVVMYAGQVVEQGPTAELFKEPKHPYTAGLIAAIPNILHRSQQLSFIPGRVPYPGQWPQGCRFAARCGHRRDRCEEAPVPMWTAAPGREARCLRHEELRLPGTDDAPEAAAAPPPAEAAPVAPETADLVVAEGLAKSFVQKRNWFGRPTDRHPAVREVSVTVKPGETLVVVGESGAGKSTLGRMLLRLEDPDAGTIVFNGADIRRYGARELRKWRADAQMIFQDPFNSFDPRVTILASLIEPMKVHGILDPEARRERALDLLERVGLSRDHAERFPYEFSGGQLQRIAIARALTTEPKLIVCDEPVAALDMSIRAQVINLLRDLQAERGLSYVFITHDLSLVRIIAHRVMVMYRGTLVEIGDGAKVFDHPYHPYTRRLLEAIPVPNPANRRLMNFERLVINEAFAQITDHGCAYARYCPHATERCGEVTPPLVETPSGMVSCHLYGETGAVPSEVAPGARAGAAG